MRTMTKTLTLALLAAAPGCVHATADVDADQNVSFDMPGNTITIANQAFAASQPLTGAGTAQLIVEMVDVAALGASAGPRIQFHFNAHVSADAKKDLL